MPLSVGHAGRVERERLRGGRPTARTVDANKRPANNVGFINSSLSGLRLYPNSALLIASGVVGFSQRFTPAKRAGTALAS
jgi:hypothetical protein